MTDPIDQALDERLRRELGVAIPDDGFSARVMRYLPPRPRRRPWLLPSAVLVGAFLSWLALLPSPIFQQATQEWLAGDLGPTSALLLALLLGVGLLGCGWALDEAP